MILALPAPLSTHHLVVLLNNDNSCYQIMVLHNIIWNEIWSDCWCLDPLMYSTSSELSATDRTKHKAVQFIRCIHPRAFHPVQTPFLYWLSWQWLTFFYSEKKISLSCHIVQWGSSNLIIVLGIVHFIFFKLHERTYETDLPRPECNSTRIIRDSLLQIARRSFLLMRRTRESSFFDQSAYLRDWIFILYLSRYTQVKASELKEPLRTLLSSLKVNS
jgi:hypothetical protein